MSKMKTEEEEKTPSKKLSTLRAQLKGFEMKLMPVKTNEEEETEME